MERWDALLDGERAEMFAHLEDEYRSHSGLFERTYDMNSDRISKHASVTTEVYVYNRVEYPSFAKFCEVIESFHGRILSFENGLVEVDWENTMNKRHFEEHVYGK